MGCSTDATRMGAVWLPTHIDRKRLKNMTARRNKWGEWPSFFCSHAATRSSNWHLARAQDSV